MIGWEKSNYILAQAVLSETSPPGGDFWVPAAPSSGGCNSVGRFILHEKIGSNPAVGLLPKGQVNQSPKEIPMLRAAMISCASPGTNLVFPAISDRGLWPTLLPIMATA